MRDKELARRIAAAHSERIASEWVHPDEIEKGDTFEMKGQDKEFVALSDPRPYRKGRPGEVVIDVQVQDGGGVRDWGETAFPSTKNVRILN